MRNAIDKLLTHSNEVILGKSHPIKLAVCCLFAQGHLLIEDIPGVGKTTLAHTLASLLGMQYQRIQFTSDLLPADIIGATIFDAEQHTFQFHPGPIFNQMVLADEINRATPKAQSALLEAMEEQQITVEGITHNLPNPFFVIATQNPSHQIGTFPLPESQLDRFLMRIELGYPDLQAERAILQGKNRQQMIEKLPICVPAEILADIQQIIPGIHASAALLDYLLALVTYSRESSDYQSGLSPRAALGLLSAAKAWAFLDHRDSVLPEDVQAVLPSVAGHRLSASTSTATDSTSIVEPLLRNIPVA